MTGKDISILFVEDDTEIYSSILAFLETLSFKKIYLAKDAEAGLEQFWLHKPDIVLTDLHMPGMSGLELASIIKNHSAGTPIILTTSQFEKEVTEDAIDIGIDAYIFKPISLERLKKILYKQRDQIVQKRSFVEEQKLLREYKSALDVSASVSKTDIKGVITYVNNSFCLMSGYEEKELLGKRHSLVRHPDTPKAIYVDMWRTISKKKVWKGRIKNLKKGAIPYYDQTVIVPIVNDGGVTVEFIAIHHDVTDLYTQEEYLKKRITEEVKKNLLETKYSTIGRMAAGITHEINTPLTYIRGNVELMLEDIRALPNALEQKRYLEEDARVVADGVGRIANIVESMREMASQTKAKSEPCNVYASLITALTLSYNKVKQVSKILIKGAPFSIGMDKERFVYMAEIQRQRVEQVWIIIINNAIDALKHRDEYEERLLEISIEYENEYVVARFLDNAGGIDEAMIPKIFDPFESTKEEGGMGIGLNVARRIIEDNKAKIVASNYEDGALFEVYLPRC